MSGEEKRCKRSLDSALHTEASSVLVFFAVTIIFIAKGANVQAWSAWVDVADMLSPVCFGAAKFRTVLLCCGCSHLVLFVFGVRFVCG